MAGYYCVVVGVGGTGAGDSILGAEDCGSAFGVRGEEAEGDEAGGAEGWGWGEEEEEVGEGVADGFGAAETDDRGFLQVVEGDEAGRLREGQVDKDARDFDMSGG